MAAHDGGWLGSMEHERGTVMRQCCTCLRVLSSQVLHCRLLHALTTLLHPLHRHGFDDYNLLMVLLRHYGGGPILSLFHSELSDGPRCFTNPRQCCCTDLLCDVQSAPHLSPFALSFTVFTHGAAAALLGRQPFPSDVARPAEVTAHQRSCRLPTCSDSATLCPQGMTEVLCTPCHGSQPSPP